MVYSTRMKQIRERLSLTQEEVSNILSIDRKTYSNYENEDLLMPIKHLITLCEYYEISLDYLFNFTDIKNYKNIESTINNKASGIKLKEFRKEHKLTQVALAKILHTTQANIVLYEKGTNLISTPFLYTICKKYKISADYILGKIDNPKYLK